MRYNKILGAIDIGQTKTIAGLVNENGTIIEKKRFQTDISVDPEQHLAKCISALQECLQNSGYGEDVLVGIGMTVPGLADSLNGILINAPFAGWKNVRVKEFINSHYPDRMVEIANDVNACALGELMFGKGKDYLNYLWVTISTGIGGGVIINGDIYEGESGISGEIGHVVVEWKNGRTCSCGKRGCLEAHASGTAIARIVKEKYLNGCCENNLSRYLSERNLEVSAESVAKAARDGIESAIEEYREAGRYIGRAFSYAANILNPGCIIVGGGVGLSLDLLEGGIKEVIQTAVIGDANRNIPILSTGLGYEAALIGAASLVLKKLK